MKIELDENHKYTVDGVPYPGVTEILGSVGIPDLSKIPVDVLEAARNRGGNVHRITELYDKETLDEEDLKLNNEMGYVYLTQWKKARMVLGLSVVTRNEFRVFHSAGYCGTIDRIFNENILVDLKTGISGSAGIQTSAYADAYLDMTGTKIKKRYAVTLLPDSYKVIPLSSPTDINYFQSAFNIYRWKNGGKK